MRCHLENKTPRLAGALEADEGTRTLDLLHGKQTLYQLSYIREGAQYSRGLRGAQLLAEQRHDVVGLRVAAEHRLREHELAVHVNVEDPVRARHDLDGADGVLPFLEDPRRQTGGVRERPSGDAVLDADVVAVGHHTFSPWPIRTWLGRAPR